MLIKLPKYFLYEIKDAPNKPLLVLFRADKGPTRNGVYGCSFSAVTPRGHWCYMPEALLVSQLDKETALDVIAELETGQITEVPQDLMGTVLRDDIPQICHSNISGDLIGLKNFAFLHCRIEQSTRGYALDDVIFHDCAFESGVVINGIEICDDNLPIDMYGVTFQDCWVTETVCE